MEKNHFRQIIDCCAKIRKTIETTFSFQSRLFNSELPMSRALLEGMPLVIAWCQHGVRTSCRMLVLGVEAVVLADMGQKLSNCHGKKCLPKWAVASHV